MTEPWERQKGENHVSFIYFKVYRDLPLAEKTYQDVINYFENDRTHKELEEELGKEITIPTLKRLQNLASKWNWKERDRAYQNYNDEMDRLQNNEVFREDNDEMGELIKQNIAVAKKHTQELEDNDADYALSTRTRLGLDLAKTIDILNKNFRLKHGRSISISESTNDVKVEAEVEYFGLKDLADIYDKKREEYIKAKNETLES